MRLEADIFGFKTFPEKSINFCKRDHSSITSAKRWWVGGGGQLLMFADKVGGWVGVAKYMLTWANKKKKISNEKNVSLHAQKKVNFFGTYFFYKHFFPRLAIFIREKKIYIGGWVWRNADVMFKVGIRNADVCW